MSRLLALAILSGSLAACPQPGPGPAPVPPDATDGASPSADPCQAACDRMVALGCVVGTACVAAEHHMQDAKEIRKPAGGALTCADVAAALSLAELRTLGVRCGP